MVTTSLAMNTNMLIAIAAVVIIAAAGTGVYFIVKDNGDDDKEIEPRDVTITDSLGNEVTVTAPLTKVCTVNTNAAEFFKILGVQDRIVGIDSSGKESLGDIYGDVTDIGNYKTPSGEKILETGATYVISQSSSRSLSTETEQALKDLGVTVLRIDCFGETMFTDVGELLKILIDDDADDAFEEYKATYESVVNTVKQKSEGAADDPAFLFLFTSRSKENTGNYYTDNSELVKIAVGIHGHNALSAMGVKQTSASSNVASEKFLDSDQKGLIDYVFVRGTATTTASQDYSTFKTTLKNVESDYNDLTVVKNRTIFVINTDLLSGPRDYIGQICIAEAFGIDTGLDYQKITDDFNEKYGFDVEYSYYMTQFPAA